MTADKHVAFVAGATGYVGRYVVQVLRSRGIETFAHVRFDSPRLGEWRKHFAALGAETCSAPWESCSKTTSSLPAIRS